MLRRPIALVVLSLALLAGSVPACSGGGDDGDDDDDGTPTVTPMPDPTPLAGSIAESEPNDVPADATAVTSSDASFAFHGRCGQTGDPDWFAMDLALGSYLVSLTWDERTYIPEQIPNDLDFYVHDSSGQIAKNDDFEPEGGDSPADAVAIVGSAGTVRVLVDCFQADEDLFYQGELVPGS